LALIPAAGVMAYAASAPMVQGNLGRLLLDQSAHKIPFGLYKRLHLARLTAPRALERKKGHPPDAIVAPTARQDSHQPKTNVGAQTGRPWIENKPLTRRAPQWPLLPLTTGTTVAYAQAKDGGWYSGTDWTWTGATRAWRVTPQDGPQSLYKYLLYLPVSPDLPARQNGGYHRPIALQPQGQERAAEEISA